MAEPNRSERDEMKLLAALGTALPSARGPLPETKEVRHREYRRGGVGWQVALTRHAGILDATVWTKALQLAERLDDGEYQLRAMWGLFFYRMYVENYRGALELADRFCAVADKKGDASARLLGDRLTGIALHHLGDHANARRRLDRVLSQYVGSVHRSHVSGVLVDPRVAARTTLARVLWVQGFADQAVRSAQSALDEAQATDHALSVCHALARAACPVALYVGDLAAAKGFVATLLEYSAKHASLALWDALGRCLNGTLLLAQHDADGLALLRTALDWVREARFGHYEAIFLGTLAQGMAAAGQTAEARTIIDEALDRCERSEGRWCLPELLRLKGELLRLDGSADAIAAAEDHHKQALGWARRQEALSWELRAATSLAELWHARGETADAEQLLSSVYDRFNEGFGTSDLKTARALIDELRSVPARS